LQPGGSSTETNDENSDAFDHGHVFLCSSSGADEHANHVESLDGPDLAEDECDFEDEDEEMEDGPFGSYSVSYQIGYCVNCTAPLYSDTCDSCNHTSSANQNLFNTARDTVQSTPSTSSQSSTIIVWDERMLLHDEGKKAPHPERYVPAILL
jgi:hypothetical protein